MSEGETYILKRRDLAEIIQLQDTGALADFLEQPATTIAEVVTGWLASGTGCWAPTAGRIVQGALKGKMFEQVGREIKQFREKGRIPDDFAEKKYGFKSWVDLLTIIDEDPPDEDRLEALKAMFYSINKIKATDGERILAYQLFQIAKKLSSGQLLVLKAAQELKARGEFGADRTFSGEEFCRDVARSLGHEVWSLVEREAKVLAEYGLIGHLERKTSYGSSQGYFPLTDLGDAFCQNLQDYRTASESSKQGSS